MRKPRHRHGRTRGRARGVTTKLHRAAKARAKRNADGIEYIGDTLTERVIALATEMGQDVGGDRWRAEVARRLGVNVSTLRAVLRGDANAGLRVAQDVSTHTKYTIGQLFGEAR